MDADLHGAGLGIDLDGDPGDGRRQARQGPAVVAGDLHRLAFGQEAGLVLRDMDDQGQQIGMDQAQEGRVGADQFADHQGLVGHHRRR